jgi:hypothetical protein
MLERQVVSAQHRERPLASRLAQGMAPILIIFLGFFVALFLVRRLESIEVRYAMGAFGLHMVSSFAQYWLQEFYYGMTDAHGYMDAGATLARLLEFDFFRFAPEIAKLAFHVETELPFEAFGAGHSTGTVSAIGGVFVYLFGPSLLSACLATSVISWFGQLCFYLVARDEFPVDDRRATLVGCLLVPSAVFWGGAFAKESLVMGSFGALGLMTHRAIRRRSLLAAIGAGLAGIGVGLVKPYILFPYFIGLAAWLYAERAWQTDGGLRVRPLYLIMAVGAAVGGVALLGTIFPEFGVGRVADTVAQQQALWQQTEGGSNIELGSGEARSFLQQLPFVPIALANALFRPTIFEARNAPTLGAALEMTLMTFGVVWLIVRHSWSRTRAALMRSPPLVFAFVFILFFSIAVGLATSNLGSLSRYRVPMMPFYATALLVLLRHVRGAPQRHSDVDLAHEEAM